MWRDRVMSLDESEGSCPLVLEVIYPDRNDCKKGPICGDTLGWGCQAVCARARATASDRGGRRDAEDATVDRRGSHHRHDGLPAQGGLESEGAGIWNWLSAGIEGEVSKIMSCQCFRV